MSFAEFHWMGGTLFMSILSLSLTTIVAATVWNAVRLSKGTYGKGNKMLNIADIRAIGIFAIIWGIFGQSIGLFSAMQALESSPDVSPAMIYGGIKVSFITTLYGTFIFLLSWLISFVLNNWNRNKS